METTDALDHFKRQINLSEYPASQGYVLATPESSRNYALMRHSNGDTILIARRGDEVWKYYSARKKHDQGTVVEFIRHRQGLSHNEIIAALSLWSTRAHPCLATTFAQALNPVNEDRERLIQAFSKMRVSIPHPYLKTLRIGPAVLQNPRFRGRVLLDSQANTGFPHYHREGLSGDEIKYPHGTGFVEAGEKGVWHSRAWEKDNRLVFTSTAVDALSHAILCQDDRPRYLSTRGPLQTTQRALILKRDGQAASQWHCGARLYQRSRRGEISSGHPPHDSLHAPPPG
jgi:hypothetical protein